MWAWPPCDLVGRQRETHGESRAQTLTLRLTAVLAQAAAYVGSRPGRAARFGGAKASASSSPESKSGCAAARARFVSSLGSSQALHLAALAGLASVHLEHSHPAALGFLRGSPHAEH